MRVLPALVLAGSAAAQQSVWGQCGGTGWTGPTTCVSGSTCTVSNAWYSQCIPGGNGNPVTTPSATTPPATTPPVSTMSNPPATLPASETTTAAGEDPSTCPTIPGNISPPSVATLNDPFTPLSGSRITTKAQWTCRQDEIKQLFEKYELGTLPPKPSSVTGSFSGSTLTINVSEGGKSISFTASITYPSSGTAPYPAIIAIGGLSIPTPAGVAVINFGNDDIAAQASGSSRGQGKFYTIYGADHSAGATTAWAWGVSRLIDVLETQATAARINVNKLGVSGCSRNGKGAFIVGALEPRIALTIPQESGSGGAACWRISDDVFAAGGNIQTAHEIVDENVWFSPNFNAYVNSIPTVPFDHHMLAGLVAPRGLFVIENNIDWLGPMSTTGCMKTGQLIYQALGVADNMGFSETSEHSHCSFPSSQQDDLTAFVQKFLFDQSTNTAVSKSDQTFDQAKWVTWSVPTLT
ncbi:hypothetical protein V491_08333 [Pseudogymnoascus sp. VKM F-3775]|nr:hypothetical protein V491_08333 [Pseudogymnoascus sp. VKM F-3775]